MKKLLYVLIAFITIIVVFSCQDDDIIELRVEKIKKEPVFTTKILSGNNMPKLDNLQSAIEQAKKILSTNSSQKSTVYDTINGFWIDESKVQHISSGEYESYTYAVIDPVDQSNLKNLLLQKQIDSSYLPILLTYKIDSIDFSNSSIEYKVLDNSVANSFQKSDIIDFIIGNLNTCTEVIFSGLDDCACWSLSGNVITIDILEDSCSVFGTPPENTIEPGPGGSGGGNTSSPGSQTPGGNNTGGGGYNGSSSGSTGQRNDDTDNNQINTPQQDDCLTLSNGDCFSGSATSIIKPDDVLIRVSELRNIIETPINNFESEEILKERIKAVGEYFKLTSHVEFSELELILNEVSQEDNLSHSDLLLMAGLTKQAYELLKPYAIQLITIGSLSDMSTVVPPDILDIIEKNLTQVAILPQVKNITGQAWPQGTLQWEALGEILFQSHFLIEIGVGFIPGSSIIDVVDGISNDDYLALTFGIAGLVVDAFGGTIVKAIGKIGKVAYKGFKIFRIVVDFLTEITNTIQYGLKVVVDDNVAKILNDLDQEIARVYNGFGVSKVLKFNYSGFGGDIITNPNKTTTLIGRWGGQLEDIWNTGLAKQGDNVGGLNILGEPLGNGVDEVWAFNESWLLDAINRSDVIRVTADPAIASNLIFQNTNNVIFNSFDDVISYMTSFTNIAPEFSNLGYFGREVHTLINNGYSFNVITKTFEP